MLLIGVRFETTTTNRNTHNGATSRFTGFRTRGVMFRGRELGEYIKEVVVWRFGKMLNDHFLFDSFSLEKLTFFYA